MASNGGFVSYANRTTKYGSRGAEPCKNTRQIIVKSGQVIKAMSWLESDTSGKMIAKATMTELASTVFAGTAAISDTIIIGGLTLTTTAAMTPAEVVTAFISKTTTKGTFSGTLSGWTLQAGATTATLEAISTTYLTDVSNFAITGTHTGLTHPITITAGGTAQKPATGLLLFDVDATSVDVPAVMYISGNFWSEEIVWEVDTVIDTVTKADNTTVAVTAYNTGCVTELAKQKFIENTAGGTEFAIGTWTTGETEI